MNDKELADRVVALGVGIKSNRGISEYSHDLYDFPGFPYPVCDDVFVRDWRVTGAMMEKCAKRKRTIALSFGCDVFNATDAESATPTYGVYLERSNENAPRAIIEACVEASS